MGVRYSAKVVVGVMVYKHREVSKAVRYDYVTGKPHAANVVSYWYAVGDRRLTDKEFAALDAAPHPLAFHPCNAELESGVVGVLGVCHAAVSADAGGEAKEIGGLSAAQAQCYALLLGVGVMANPQFHLLIDAS